MRRKTVSRISPVSDELGPLAKIVLSCGVMLLLADLLWHGVTIATVHRVWRQLIERPSGPVAFRFILQPLMALAFALRDGLFDARTNRFPYAWTVLCNPKKRMSLLREGVNATARIIALGIVMDAVYQLLVLKRLYPAEAVSVALLLAWVPYAFFRGIVTRAAMVRAGRSSVPRDINHGRR